MRNYAVAVVGLDTRKNVRMLDMQLIKAKTRSAAEKLVFEELKKDNVNLVIEMWVSSEVTEKVC